MASPESVSALASFVREFALAWQRMTMYQEGHPARRDVAVKVHAILAALVAPRGAIVLGVSRESIVSAEEKIATPAARRLAECLYLRNVAMVKFDEGITVDDLERFLALLPRGRPLEDDPALWDLLPAIGIGHIDLEPIDFSGVVAADGDAEDSLLGVGESGGSVFEEIIRRLLNDERFGGVTEVRELALDSSMSEIVGVIQRVIARHGGATDGGGSSDAVEVLAGLGGLLGGAVTTGLTGAPDPGARAAAARHVAELLTALPEDLRESVLDSALVQLTQDDGEAESLMELSGSVAAGQVVASLRRLRAEGVSFSPRSLGLMEDLVLRSAPMLEGPVGLEDPEAVARGLADVFGDDDVDRVVPTQERMDRVALELRRCEPLPAAPEELGPRVETLGEQKQIVQLAQTLMDLIKQPIFDDTQSGWVADRVELVLQQLLAAGRMTNSVGLVRQLKALADDAAHGQAVRIAAERCIQRFEEPETIAALVEALGTMSASNVPLVHQLIDLVGERVVGKLLLALCEESDMARRRHTFDLVVSLGPAVAPHALELLGDKRWYVTRNMLSVLRRAGESVPLARLRPTLAHRDERVRLEAVKCLGAVEEEIPAVVLGLLLEDEASKVVEATIAAVGAYQLGTAYQPLVEMLKKADPLARQTEVRVKALHALGQIGRQDALSDLSHYFRGWFSVVSADERRAAYRSLANYPPGARDPIVRKGLKSPDAAVRAICKKLQGGAS